MPTTGCLGRKLQSTEAKGVCVGEQLEMVRKMNRSQHPGYFHSGFFFTAPGYRVELNSAVNSNRQCTSQHQTCHVTKPIFCWVTALAYLSQHWPQKLTAVLTRVSENVPARSSYCKGGSSPKQPSISFLASRLFFLIGGVQNLDGELKPPHWSGHPDATEGKKDLLKC